MDTNAWNRKLKQLFCGSHKLESTYQQTQRAINFATTEIDGYRFAPPILSAGDRAPSLRGAKRRSNPFFLCGSRWIASLRSQ